MSSLRLQSVDGAVFEVDLKVAKTFGTIKTMLENLGPQSEEDEEEPIVLSNVSGEILGLAIKWAIHHKDDDSQSEDDAPAAAAAMSKRTDDLSEWDVEFLAVDQGILYDLILAANYLDIRGLLDACCKTVANMIKNKSASEIRRTFNLTDDFSEEEWKQMLTTP